MKVYRWVFYYWALFFVSWGAMVFLTSPKILDHFVADADTLIKLLDGYSKQQLWFFGVMCFVLLLLIGGAGVIIFCLIKNYLHLRKCTRYRDRDLKYPLMGLFDPIVAIIIAALFSVFPILILRDERPFRTYQQLKQEMMAVEEGKLEEAIVCFSSRYEEVAFASIGKDYKKTVTRYKDIELENEDGDFSQWGDCYVPMFMDFQLEREQEYRPGNTKQAARYLITYTPEFHFVYSIQVVEPDIFVSERMIKGEVKEQF